MDRTDTTIEASAGSSASSDRASLRGKPRIQFTASRAERAGNERRHGARTQLYRHFDASDQLLYVGISLSVVTRLTQHRHSSEWFGAIAKVTVETFETREAALQAESLAIATEAPKHNRQGTALGVLSGPELRKSVDMRLFDPDNGCPKCGSEDQPGAVSLAERLRISFGVE